jgi:hypothetical protein
MVTRRTRQHAPQQVAALGTETAHHRGTAFSQALSSATTRLYSSPTTTRTDRPKRSAFQFARRAHH